jgi:hypothetical protein
MSNVTRFFNEKTTRYNHPFFNLEINGPVKNQHMLNLEKNEY